MIELLNDSLVFTFPDVHPKARLSIQFQRTLRIPDNDKTYPLPPGLGAFPLRHVDDHAKRVPSEWLEHGGVMMPMYQAEALWLHFNSQYLPDHHTAYPFAIKVATGKIDAVTGKSWSNSLGREPQNYMVSPSQPWLDGYCVSKGTIRQFVAMPLGEGYSAEEQLTGEAEHGGLQLVVYPMKRKVFDRRFPETVAEARRLFAGESIRRKQRGAPAAAMGLAPGGKMKQEIHRDPFDLDDWELDHRNRCFVHILNSHWWQAMTGEKPPHQPPTAKQYTQAGLPWFDFYDADAVPVEGSSILAGLQSVAQKSHEKRDRWTDDAGVDPERIIKLRAGLTKSQVRDGTF